MADPAIQNAVKHLEAQNYIALSHMRDGQPVLAVELLEKGMQYANTLGDTDEVQQAKIALSGNLGQAYQQLGDTARAIPLLEMQPALARKYGGRKAESNALNGLGICCFKQGDSERAEEFLQKRIALSEQIGDLQGLGNSLNNLANIYTSQKQYEKARELLEKRIGIARQIGDQRGEASSLGNLAELYVTTNQPGKAKQTLRTAIAVMEQASDPRIGQVRARLGELELSKRTWTADVDDVNWTCSVTPDGLVVLLGL